jgi:hypothetical protein
MWISRWFELDEVRMAHGYMLYLVAVQIQGGDGVEPVPPKAKTAAMPDWYEKAVEEKQAAHMEEGRHITTTERALGIPPLMFVTPFTLLADTDKAQTRLLEVPQLGGKVVCKFVNFLSTPKFADWSEETLLVLEEREIAAYQHLAALQETVVPRFIFNGSDYNFFFVTVTSYEGVSLKHMVEELGYLELPVRQRAVDALRIIHGAGVLHGDVALRNVVCREGDGKVAWVDFEMAKVRDDGDDGDDDDSTWFEEAAKEEMEMLVELWRDVPVEPPPSKVAIEEVVDAAGDDEFVAERERAVVAPPYSSAVRAVKRVRKEVPCGGCC